MRAKLYLIAAAFYQQPDRETLQRFGELASSLLFEKSCDGQWRLLIESIPPHSRLCHDDLIAEYSRLFVLGAPHVAAQPFASFWLERERQLMGKTTLCIREMMAAHGLQADGGFLPDHIVSELEFMAWLADHRASTRATQRWLLSEHLACWTPRFTAALREARPSSWFLAAADFLDRLIAWDLSNVASAPDRPSRYSLARGVA